MAIEETSSSRERSEAQEITALVARSIQRDLPVFLVVVYRWEVEKVAFLAALRRELETRGIGSRTLDLAGEPEQGTGKLYGWLEESAADELSLVIGLPRRVGGFRLDSDFLRYLNLHRDRIGRQRLRWVLFLHESDLDQLLREAGDLWDVRQHIWWLEREPQRMESGIWIPLRTKNDAFPLKDRDEEGIDRHLRAVRRLVEETKEPEARGRLLLDLSTWLLRRGAGDQAIRVAFQGLEACPADSDPKLVGELEKVAGEAFAQSSRWKEAIEHLEKASTLLGRQPRGRSRAEIAESLGRLYRATGQAETALEQLEESAALYQETGATERAARVKTDLVGVRYELGEKATESELLEIANQIYEQSHDAALFVFVLERFAGMLLAQGQRIHTLEALRLASEALSWLEPDLGGEEVLQAGAPEEEWQKAALRNDLSLIYADLGRFDEALQAAKHSLASFRLLKAKREEAIVLSNLSLLLASFGWLERAVEAARSAVQIGERIGHPDLGHLKALRVDVERRLERQRILTASRVAEPEPPKYGT